MTLQSTRRAPRPGFMKLTGIMARSGYRERWATIITLDDMHAERYYLMP
jgi:hypothetical protein